jgi:endonuclease G
VILERIKAIVGPNNMPPVEQSKLAEAALERMRNGKKPTPKQLAALEFVIRLMRPVPLSREGALDALDSKVAPSFPDWGGFQTSVKPHLYSVGRIDLWPKEGVGTGWLVSDGVIVTNRHVLDVLSKGTGQLEKGQAVVRFKFEAGMPDVALLKVDKQTFTDARKPLELDTEPIEEGHPVVAVGYPFDDSKRNPLFISALFGGTFGVKRAAPGECSGRGAKSIFHDCSTLGGNSGSPIFSMKTGRVVGLHRDGYFLYRNEAVDGASLDAFIRPRL